MSIFHPQKLPKLEQQFFISLVEQFHHLDFPAARKCREMEAFCQQLHWACFFQIFEKNTNEEKIEWRMKI